MPKAPKYWLVGIIFLFFLMGSSALAQSGEGVIFWVPVKDVPNLGMVDWGLASFVSRALQEAEEAGAQAVVLEIDTSGGLVDAMLFIKDAIISSPCYTVAFINHRAWSAGTFIALACETIVFAPDATMGAAEPRSGAAGEVEQPDPKTVSAIRAQIEALAEARGRDPLLFASMVDRNLEIDGLVKKGELLTLRASQALEYGAGDLVATTREELLNKLGLEGTVRELSPSWSENLARLITNPVIVPILLLLALGGILLEVLTPGFGIPGIIGLVSFSLFFWRSLSCWSSGMGASYFFLSRGNSFDCGAFSTWIWNNRDFGDRSVSSLYLSCSSGNQYFVLARSFVSIVFLHCSDGGSVSGFACFSSSKPGVAKIGAEKRNNRASLRNRRKRLGTFSGGKNGNS